MEHIGQQDGRRTYKKSGMHLAVFTEDQSSAEDAIDGLEVAHQIRREGVHVPQQTDMESVGEHGAKPCQ